MTMAYIICVQPVVPSKCGMDFGAVMIATCIAIPAFLTQLTMPLTFSITEGISFGFISYSFLKLIRGRGKEVHLVAYIFAALFILRYTFLQI